MYPKRETQTTRTQRLNKIYARIISDKDPKKPIPGFRVGKRKKEEK